MLDAQASWEGPFLDGFGDANYTDDISDTLGTVYMNGFFVSPPTNPPNGSGVLATVGFNATWQYNVSSTSLPPIGCSLSLYDTTLLNPVNATIDHTVVNATYNAPYKPEVLDHAIVFGGITYHVITESNSSVSPVPMNFNQSGKFVSFNVTGKSGYAGYCKVTIPRNFLNASCTATQRWQVWVDDVLISRTCTLNDADNNTLTFTYNFMSTTRTVKIVGFWVVPEFPIAMILPLLLMATLTAAILGKRVRSGKCRGSSVAE